MKQKRLQTGTKRVEVHRGEERVSDEEVCKDILARLDETHQIYIVGHDIPLSISRPLFDMLESARKKLAELKRVPENQMEYEDVLFALLTGIS
ncbi:MAG: hypothetical protein ACE5IJ_12070 [Thermoplasmata archaeon]